MKPIIAKSVYNALSNIAHPLADDLGRNLSNATVLGDESIDKNVVSLNSTVEYVCEPYSSPVSIQIVLPEYEDLKRRKVSVLAPISRALLGYKASDEFFAALPSGEKKIRILNVRN